MTPAFNVLFLCTRNSARSIMAEAILQKIGGSRFRAYSAGSDPIAEPNPEVIAKLRAFGHDTDGLRSKSWHEFTGPNAPRMDFVITLCDTLEGPVCPDFGDLAVTGAWPLPDPAKFTGSAVERSIAAERALRQPAPADRNLHVAALRVARPHGDEGAARRDRRRTDVSRRGVRADHARRHQRHGPDRPPGAARGNGRHVPASGRSARRITASTSCT